MTNMIVDKRRRPNCTIPYIELTYGVPLTEFVKAHPCEVWKGDKFIGRFQSMECAANTALHNGPFSQVRDTSTGEEWDWKMCVNRGRISYT